MISRHCRIIRTLQKTFQSTLTVIADSSRQQIRTVLIMDHYAILPNMAVFLDRCLWYTVFSWNEFFLRDETLCSSQAKRLHASVFKWQGGMCSYSCSICIIWALAFGTDPHPLILLNFYDGLDKANCTLRINFCLGYTGLRKLTHIYHVCTAVADLYQRFQKPEIGLTLFSTARAFAETVHVNIWCNDDSYMQGNDAAEIVKNVNCEKKADGFKASRSLKCSKATKFCFTEINGLALQISYENANWFILSRRTFNELILKTCSDSIPLLALSKTATIQASLSFVIRQVILF